MFQGLARARDGPARPVPKLGQIQALSILTGQTKGFHPLFPEDRRERSIAMWQHWLEQYRAEL